MLLQKVLRLTPTCLCTTVRSITQQNTFEDEFVKHHIPVTGLQRSILSIGSAAISIIDPHRHDMIACMGETTGHNALKNIWAQMHESEEGTRILKERPRINSKTVDLEKLKMLPEGTLGKVYSNFLENNRVTPDSRMTVQFLDDVNLAYIIQRYREIHDLVHTILEMPTNMLGEVTVKWVEAIQTKLPMCIGAAVFGPVRLKPKHRQLYRTYYLPWALRIGYNSSFLMNVYFEERWEQPLFELHRELNIKSFVKP